MTRRHALTAAAGITAAASLASTSLLATPAVAAPQPLRNDELKEALRRVEARRRRLLTGRPSANRWEMQKAADDGGDIGTRHVAGTRLNVSVLASCISRNSDCRLVPESVVDQLTRQCRREMGSGTDLGERSRSVAVRSIARVRDWSGRRRSEPRPPISCVT